MASYTSTGTGDWNVAATWGEETNTPGEADNATIANGHTVTGNVSHNIASSCHVTVDAGGTLNINNGVAFSIATGGNLLVSGACNLSGELSGGTGAGLTIYNGGVLTALAGATWSMIAGSSVDVQTGGTLDLNLDPVTLAGSWYGGGDITCESRLTIDSGASFSDMIANGGDLILDFGAVVAATLNSNDVALPDVEVSNNGITTCALVTNGLTCKTFTFTAGAFDDGGQDVVVGGHLLINGGVLTSTGNWGQNASGNVVNDTDGHFYLLELAVSGAVSTLTGEVHADRLQYGTGTVVLGDFDLVVYYSASTANAWTDGTGGFTAAGTGIVKFSCGQVAATQGTAVTITAPLEITTDNSTGGELTFSANLNLAANALNIRGVDVNKEGEVVFANASLTCGALTIGSTAAEDKSGIVHFGGGAHNIASLAQGNAANDSDEVQLDTCRLYASGTLDFTDITHAATAGMVHIICTGTGEVSNFAPAEAVHVHGDASVDASGNGGSATFNTHAHPGGLAMMGAGVA